MADRTKIEWAANADGSAGASWNPIRARNRADGRVGWFCIHASAGCKHCYAEPINRRVGAGVDYAAQNRDQVDIFLDEKTLLQPLRWKRPRTIFVCSMTDLFGEFVADAMIDRVFAIMALCTQHTFIVLTKRSTRMRTHLAAGAKERVIFALDIIRAQTRARIDAAKPRRMVATVDDIIAHDAHATQLNLQEGFAPWPLRNVWLGVSAEDQRNADARIPDLLDTPATIRLLSAEPLLAPIDLTSAWIRPQRGCAGTHSHNGVRGMTIHGVRHEIDPHRPHHHHDEFCGPRLDWIIAGGESGPNARPMHPDWARRLRDQCEDASLPFFFKQWGAWIEHDHHIDGPNVRTIETDTPEAEEELARCRNPGWITASGQFIADVRQLPKDVPARLMDRVGKRAAGRILDGRTHDERPAFRAAP